TEEFKRMFKSIVVPDDVIEQILTLINEDKSKVIDEKRNTIATLKAEMTKYENRIGRLYEDYLDGKVDETLYDRKSKEYRTMIDKLKTQISTFELSENDRYETVSHLLEVSKNAHRIFEEADYIGKRKLLKKVLSNSRLMSDTLLLKMKKPYDL